MSVLVFSPAASPAVLRGGFALKQEPSAIQPGNRATAVVVFTGSVTNSTNTGTTVSGRVELVIGIDLAFFGSASTPVLTFPPGTTPVSLSMPIEAADPPGEVVAWASLFDPADTRLEFLFSGVLGTIEVLPIPADLGIGVRVDWVTSSGDFAAEVIGGPLASSFAGECRWRVRFLTGEVFELEGRDLRITGGIRTGATCSGAPAGGEPAPLFPIGATVRFIGFTATYIVREQVFERDAPGEWSYGLSIPGSIVVAAWALEFQLELA